MDPTSSPQGANKKGSTITLTHEEGVKRYGRRFTGEHLGKFGPDKGKRGAGYTGKPQGRPPGALNKRKGPKEEPRKCGRPLGAKNKPKPAAQEAESGGSQTPTSATNQTAPTIPPSSTAAAQPASCPVGWAPTTDILGPPHPETPEEAKERNRRWWRNLWEDTYGPIPSQSTLPEHTMTPMPNPPTHSQLLANNYSHASIDNHLGGMSGYPYPAQPTVIYTGQQLFNTLPTTTPMGYNAPTTLVDPYANTLRPRSSLPQYPTTGAQDNFPAPTTQGSYDFSSSPYEYPDPSIWASTFGSNPSNDSSTPYRIPSMYDFSDLVVWDGGLEDGNSSAQN